MRIRNGRHQARNVALIALIMLAFMSLYEFLKQLIFPSIAIWESHVMTILVSSAIAALASFFFIKKLNDLNAALRAKNAENETLHAELQANIAKLEEALRSVKTLSGLLPVCASCKKIRDSKGRWEQMEVYIRKHSNADFSHGLCPDCAKKLYPDIFV
jgi:hypothetical protein